MAASSCAALDPGALACPPAGLQLAASAGRPSGNTTSTAVLYETAGGFGAAMGSGVAVAAAALAIALASAERRPPPVGAAAGEGDDDAPSGGPIGSVEPQADVARREPRTTERRRATRRW